jgi:glutamate--cysteine ligase catalytic subunit
VPIAHSAARTWTSYDSTQPLQNDKYRIPKSRYDSVDCYIANDSRNKEAYNDIECPINEKVFERLKGHGALFYLTVNVLLIASPAGIDDALAKHVAHLFIRDPLVIFSERVDQDDEESMDHFENIQSTNWQTIRFKPPPPNSSIAWRVEFRSMEVQLTDFENAAFSIFIVLLTRAILSFNLNFYMPISQVGRLLCNTYLD